MARTLLASLLVASSSTLALAKGGHGGGHSSSGHSGFHWGPAASHHADVGIHLVSELGKVAVHDASNALACSWNPIFRFMHPLGCGLHAYSNSAILACVLIVLVIIGTVLVLCRDWLFGL